MRISPDGRITIPRAIREAAGLLPGTDAEFVIEPDGVRIVRMTHVVQMGRGAEAVALLRGARHVSMTTDAIMALTRGNP